MADGIWVSRREGGGRWVRLSGVLYLSPVGRIDIPHEGEIYIPRQDLTRVREALANHIIEQGCPPAEAA